MPVFNWSTLNLKEVIDSAREKKLDVKYFLDQVPHSENYIYDYRNKVAYQGSRFTRSITPFRQHLKLDGLTYSCVLRLTEAQHNLIRSFMCMIS